MATSGLPSALGTPGRPAILAGGRRTTISRSARWATAAGLVLLLAAAGSGVFCFLRLLPAVASPWEIERGEGLIVAAALRLLAGHSLYPPYQQFFNGLDFPYPPLYAMLLAGLIKVGLPPFLAGRLLSLVGAAAIAGTVGRLTWRMTQSRLAAGLAAAALTLFSFAWPLWVITARVDSLATGLTLVGLVVATGRGRRPELAALPFFLLALATKETVVAAPLAVGISLLVQHRWRRAAGFGLLLLVPILAGYWLLDRQTHGAFGFDMLTLGQSRPFSGAFLSLQLVGMVTLFGPLLVLGLAALFARAATLSVRLYALCATLVVLATVGKIGAGAYYAMEMAAAAAVGLGLVAHRCRQTLLQIAPVGPADAARPAGRTPLGLTPTLLTLCALLVGCPPAVGMLNEASAAGNLPTSPRALAANQAMDALVRGAAGPVFSDAAGALVGSGHLEDVTDTFAYSQLAGSGFWDERPLTADLAGGRFSLVLLDVDPRNATPDAYGQPFQGRLTSAQAGAISSAYRLSTVVSPGTIGAPLIFVFTPRQAAP